jgi:hypothetical protein
VCDPIFELKVMETIHLKAIGVLLILVAAFFTSCTENEEAWFPVAGSGSLKTETRTVDSFNKVKCQIDGQVIIQPGDAHSVNILVQKNLLPLLETDVVNGMLYISFGSRAVETDSTIVVTITSPDVHELTFSGSGSVDSRVGIPNIYLTGSGNITCTGETDELAVKLSGSGAIDLEKMTVRKAQVKITGNGNVSLHVTDNLDVAIQGLGVVYYSGMPVVQKTISGQGRIVDKN